MDSIKEWVGAYLERTGTTKAELANQMSISRTSFYNKMDGTTEFSLGEAGKLAAIIGITTDQLLISPFDMVKRT